MRPQSPPQMYARCCIVDIEHTIAQQLQCALPIIDYCRQLQGCISYLLDPKAYVVLLDNGLTCFMFHC